MNRHECAAAVYRAAHLTAVVTDATCVIDREAGGAEALGATGVRLRPLFRMSELKKAAD